MIVGFLFDIWLMLIGAFICFSASSPPKSSTSVEIVVAHWWHQPSVAVNPLTVLLRRRY